MVLNKIPTYQEVKDWANTNFADINHPTDTTNPHNVTDDQTGAADALSSHEGDTTNPHNVTDSQTGAASALSDHEGDESNPHNVTDDQTGAASARSTVGETGDHGDLTNVSPDQHIYSPLWLDPSVVNGTSMVSRYEDQDSINEDVPNDGSATFTLLDTYIEPKVSPPFADAGQITFELNHSSEFDEDVAHDFDVLVDGTLVDEFSYSAGTSTGWNDESGNITFAVGDFPAQFTVEVTAEITTNEMYRKTEAGVHLLIESPKTLSDVQTP